MIVLLTVESVVLAILTILVVGLLRGYATVLNRLHELDSGGAATPFRTIPAVPEPVWRRIEGRVEWAPAHDIEGVSLSGEIISARTVGVEYDTVIAFLSSGCEACAGFWQELAKDQPWMVPGGSRILVVTKGPADESPEQLSALCPPAADLVMSSKAWQDFDVPGSPYVMVVDGRTGRVKGEGSGLSFSQVGGLIATAVGDSRSRTGIVKPGADREREQDVDRALLAAGISPADPSLYASSPDDGPAG